MDSLDYRVSSFKNVIDFLVALLPFTSASNVRAATVLGVSRLFGSIVGFGAVTCLRNYLQKLRAFFLMGGFLPVAVEKLHAGYLYAALSS